MKTIQHSKGLLHVETPNGIVNIYAGLTDTTNREVDTIEVIPDQFRGERKVMVRNNGGCRIRLVRCLHAKN